MSEKDIDDGTSQASSMENDQLDSKIEMEQMEEESQPKIEDTREPVPGPNTNNHDNIPNIINKEIGKDCNLSICSTNST